MFRRECESESDRRLEVVVGVFAFAALDLVGFGCGSWLRSGLGLGKPGEMGVAPNETSNNEGNGKSSAFSSLVSEAGPGPRRVKTKAFFLCASKCESSRRAIVSIGAGTDR